MRRWTAWPVIGLCVALVVASCGGSDGTAEDEAATAPAESSTTVEATSTTATTTASTTIAPPTTSTSPTISAPTISAPTTSAPTTSAPATTPAPAPAAVAYCDGTGPLPAGAVLDSSLTLDIVGDGTADDLIEAWDVDGWSRLRLTTGGSVVSEIVNPAIDGRYRPLGVATVFPGDSAELFSVVGDGSAATEVGVFGTDAAGCLFSYTYADTSDEFTMLIRPASPYRSGGICFDGGIALLTAEQRSDGTWDASSAAFEIAGPGALHYMGGTDDYAEGLDESELSPFEFDCFGLSL